MNWQSFRPHSAGSFSNVPKLILLRLKRQVRPIIDAVRTEGDEALARFARDFEKASVNASEIAATDSDFAAAENALDPKVREAMEFAARCIRKFHQDQMPEEMWLHEIRPGAFAGDRTRPIPSVACYVPRGKGAFPSVALMTSIPAKVAGVKDRYHRHATGCQREN